MVTLTPSSDVGICPLTKSASPQTRVVLESSVPLISTQVFPAMVVLPLSALSTLVTTGPGGGGGCAALISPEKTVTNASPRIAPGTWPLNPAKDFCNAFEVTGRLVET